MSETQRFEATFKKVPGTLSLTGTHVVWAPAVAGAMDRQQQAMDRVTNLLASKATSANTALMLKFQDNIPAGGLLFTFVGPKKEADRQAVQETLIPYVTANRTRAVGEDVKPSPAALAAATKSAPAPAAAAAAATPSAAGAAGTPASVAATPAGSSGAGTPGVGTPSSIRQKRKHDDGGMEAAARRRQYQLRERVLRKNPTLKMLHRELVIGKQITEDEFWDGREALLKAEEMSYAQRPGRPSRLLDDRFDLTGGKKDAKKIQGGTGVGLKKVETGPIVLNITKELTREIFEEFPVVQDAYVKNVPRISEAEFWTRYFTSTLWERHRASVRKSAMDEGSRKKDDIFDLYLEDPDWDPTPRKEMPGGIEKYLDLAATEEDHGETTTLRDVTMQAGRERSSLPLIRRFNDHSEKLLLAGRKGDAEAGKLPAVEEDLYSQIEYDDLRAPATAAPIPLNVHDTKDSNKADANKGILPGKTADELVGIAASEGEQIRGWVVNFGQVCMPNPHGPDDAALGADDGSSEYAAFTFQRDAQAMAKRVVREMHLASNAEDAVYPALPDLIVEQMRSCHNAASEFLRQYWAAVLPTPPGALGAGMHSQTPAAKGVRAAKMAKYLEGTEGKINAIVMTAEISRADPDRVRAAMAPTLGAVNVALKRERARVGA